MSLRLNIRVHLDGSRWMVAGNDLDDALYRDSEIHDFSSFKVIDISMRKSWIASNYLPTSIGFCRS